MLFFVKLVRFNVKGALSQKQSSNIIELSKE